MNDATKFGVTTVIAVVTITTGFVQFGSTYARSVQQPFLETQTAQCFSAAENAARLATTLDPETWKKAREEFWMLYWGPLAIVEDVEPDAGENNVGDVQKLMVRFGDELKKVKVIPPPDLPLSNLEVASLDIAHACRDLLTSRWRVGILTLFTQ
jgi:hypothetical protein